MKFVTFLSLNLLLTISVNAIANSTEIIDSVVTVDCCHCQNNKNNINGRDGENGVDGCPGGTVPSKNGKFYLPNSKIECNPSQSDIENNKRRINDNSSNLIYHNSELEYD